jgi:hypothetical protein
MLGRTALLYLHKQGHVHRWDMASERVGDTGFEPVTSSVSIRTPLIGGWCLIPESLVA